MVPAAGRGRRMGAPINKAFLPLDGVPLLAHTLRALQLPACGLDQIVVAVGPGETHLFQQMVQQYLQSTPPVALVVGGDDRQTSVYNALQRVDGAVDWVLVHDGARPLLSAAVVRRCLEAAKTLGSVTAAIPVKDTIKKVDAHGCVLETPSRESLWSVQTPQVFPRDVLLRAHEAARELGLSGPDDASLVERLGVPVHVVLGDEVNLKVTTPTDLLIAEVLLHKAGTAG